MSNIRIEPFTKEYLYNYSSMMIILLSCFTLYVSQFENYKNHSQYNTSQRLIKDLPKINNVDTHHQNVKSYKNQLPFLFMKNSLELNKPVMDSLIGIVENQNVNIELHIVNTNKNLKLSLARSILIQRYLESKKIKFDQISVFVTEGNTDSVVYSLNHIKN